MDSSFNEMAVDNLSFYDDSALLMQDDITQNQQQQQQYFSPSPPLRSLLSPESSPQRFCIVKNTPQKRILQQLNSNKTPQNAKLPGLYPSFADSSNTKVKTPKNFRTFNSLSSESMDTSMDDEYMDFFEMESLENNQNEGLFNFPSDLNSLICGRIKNESPENLHRRQLFQDSELTSTGDTKTPEIHRRQPVRRCLSMFDEETSPIRSMNQHQTSNIQSNYNTPLTKRTSPLCTNNFVQTPTNCGFKRPEPPCSNLSPIQVKRYKISDKENFDGSFTKFSQSFKNFESKSPKPSSSKPIFRKCMSMNDAEILTALERSDNIDEPQLIGDFSGPFALPLIEGRHRDLKSISSETLAKLINGGFDDKVATYQIIDCRYPYEYDGGHIRGAKNLYTQEQILHEFLSKQKTDANQANKEATDNKRHIIIFHCEFSSERGPKLSRFLRNNDRARNTISYPALDYPEIYLLHNGYKEFFETHSELCDPASYRPMLEPSYSEAYRHFRAKSKSWNGGDGFGAATSRKKLVTERRALHYRL